MDARYFFKPVRLDQGSKGASRHLAVEGGSIGIPIGNHPVQACHQTLKVALVRPTEEPDPYPDAAMLNTFCKMSREKHAIEITDDACQRLASGDDGKFHRLARNHSPTCNSKCLRCHGNIVPN